MGICTRVDLRASGLSGASLRKLVAAGELIPIGRRLMALPTAAPELVRAASMGARVACVSAARLRGLWVADAELGLHVSVRANYSALRPHDLDETKVHWTRHPLDLADLPAIESGRNMLLHVTQCLPLALAVATFDSVLNKGLMSADELHRLAEVRGGRFREVAAHADPRADSGLETVMRVGLGLRGVECRLQVRIEGRPVDLLIGEWLVIQADGFGPHSTSAQHERDLQQDRRLRLRGYTVLRYSYRAIMEAWSETEAEILAFMALGVHLRPTRN